MDINGKRYMDIRAMNDYYLPLVDMNADITLPSDSTKRADSVTLKTGDETLA